MQCSGFLAIYSDYRDGLISDPALRRDVRRHLRHCPRCMNYDALVARGVMALRSTSDLEPATRFGLGFKAPEAGEDVNPAHAGLMVALMLLTAVATAFWAGAERKQTSTLASEPSVVVESVPVRQAPQPLVEIRVNLDNWSVPAYVDQVQTSPNRAVSFETWVTLPR